MDITPSETAAPRLPFVFTGRGADYFGIWIVNLLLSIVTIGIYSAWAKVRRLRYLYGNTFLDDHAFDYHARPLAILKGRIVVVAVIVAVNLAVQLDPRWGGLASLILLLLVPFAIVLSLRFNARVTSWRNVRFDFHLGRGDFARGFAVFGLMPIVAALSLGLLLPVATRLAWNFVLRRLRYGTAPFKAQIPLDRLYAALLAAGLFLLGVGLLLGLGTVAFMVSGPLPIDLGGLSEDSFGEQDAAGAVILAIMGAAVMPIAFLLVFLVAGILYRVMVRNAVLSNAAVDGLARLESAMSPWRKAWIVLSNSVLILLTVGLATPWATIRSWRYSAETLAAHVTGNVDEVIAAAAAAGTAVGSEWADIEGFDVGF